jgi:two-component system LytT family sensor kinase
MSISIKHKSINWWKGNLKGLVLGLVIGTLINFFIFLFSDYKVPLDQVLGTYMFSIVISLSISNVICFAKYILSKELSGKWFAFIAYYGGCIFGMLAGTELSYLLLWQFFGVPYHFLGHPEQLGFNLTIAVIVCSILFVYESQKANYRLQTNEHELEVLKLKQLKTQAELQTLQSKINPHFLYNALNSIAGLIHQDADQAEEMTLKLSKLFRYSINSQQQNFASVKEELEVVNTYFDIEKVRFGDRINFISHADESVLSEQIPRFLIQPLIENALKHGLPNKISNAQLELSIIKKDSRLLITVIDNGVPFPDDLNAGYGLQSTFDKLTLLYQEDYEIEFINVPVKFIRISLPIIS